MLNKILIQTFERDLNKLLNEINLYKDENNLWVIKEGISNSSGNLCLHIVGNLNHFIGTLLGSSGYVRRRDEEFSSKNIPRKDIVASIENTIPMIKKSLEQFTPEDFEKDFPVEIQGGIVPTGFMLIQLATHLNYHLGQINYLRRMTEV